MIGQVPRGHSASGGMSPESRAVNAPTPTGRVEHRPKPNLPPNAYIPLWSRMCGVECKSRSQPFQDHSLIATVKVVPSAQDLRQNDREWNGCWIRSEPGDQEEGRPIPAVSPGILPARVVIMSSRLVPRVVAATRPAPARTASRIAYSSTETPACFDLPCVRCMVPGFLSACTHRRRGRLMARLPVTARPGPHRGRFTSWRGFR